MNELVCLVLFLVLMFIEWKINNVIRKYFKFKSKYNNYKNLINIEVLIKAIT